MPAFLINLLKTHLLDRLVRGFFGKALGGRKNPFHSRSVVGLLTFLAAGATYFVTNADAIRAKFREACIVLDKPPEWALAIEGLVPGATALVSIGGFLLAIFAVIDDNFIRRQPIT